MRSRHEQTLGSGVSFTLRLESSKRPSFHPSDCSLTSAHTVNTFRTINPALKTRKSIPAWILRCLISFFPAPLALSQGRQQERERDLWASGLWASGRSEFLSQRKHKWEAGTDLIDKVHFGPHVYSHAHHSTDSSVHTCGRNRSSCQ